jgi:hypothetical protein
MINILTVLAWAVVASVGLAVVWRLHEYIWLWPGPAGMHVQYQKLAALVGRADTSLDV